MAMLSAGVVGGPDAAISSTGSRQARRVAHGADGSGGAVWALLLIVGDQDEAVGMDNMAAYEARLEAANKDYESITYSGVGHGFMTFDEQAETFPQASDAWAATLQFLDEQLGGNG
ncbi:MAG: dienelactone hydrolase family protein [Thermomicrobiales bacterium]